MNKKLYCLFLSAGFPPFWCYISRNFVNWKIKKIKKVENGASVRKDGDKHQGVGNTVLTDWVGKTQQGIDEEEASPWEAGKLEGGGEPSSLRVTE